MTTKRWSRRRRSASGAEYAGLEKPSGFRGGAKRRLRPQRSWFMGVFLETLEWARLMIAGPPNHAV